MAPTSYNPSYHCYEAQTGFHYSVGMGKLRRLQSSDVIDVHTSEKKAKPIPGLNYLAMTDTKYSTAGGINSTHGIYLTLQRMLLLKTN